MESAFTPSKLHDADEGGEQCYFVVALGVVIRVCSKQEGGASTLHTIMSSFHALSFQLRNIWNENLVSSSVIFFSAFSCHQHHAFPEVKG